MNSVLHRTFGSGEDQMSMYLFMGIDTVVTWLLLPFEKAVLPMSLIPQFMDIGKEIADDHPIWGDIFIWFTVPIYTAVAWMFHTMERIGRTGENPFEGTSNDVPISTIS